MFWTGIALLVFGVIIGVIGWILNTQTPIQQPGPFVGICLVVVGLGLVFWFH